MKKPKIATFLLAWYSISFLANLISRIILLLEINPLTEIQQQFYEKYNYFDWIYTAISPLFFVVGAFFLRNRNPISIKIFIVGFILNMAYFNFFWFVRGMDEVYTELGYSTLKYFGGTIFGFLQVVFIYFYSKKIITKEVSS